MGPGSRPGEIPGEPPGEVPGLHPGEVPGEPPGEAPGEHPGAVPGEPPGVDPGESLARSLERLPVWFLDSLLQRSLANLPARVPTLTLLGSLPLVMALFLVPLDMCWMSSPLSTTCLSCSSSSSPSLGAAWRAA